LGVSHLTKIRSVLLKYKFSFIENTKHSSYLYQKVFRSIYGYTQNVTKKNNKVYSYFRNGILSNTPYIKNSKNAVILPLGCDTELIEYFDTGKNPTHNWKSKGDWKVEYTKDFIDIDIDSIIKSIEQLLNNYKIINDENKEVKLIDEIKIILFKDNLTPTYISYIYNLMKVIISLNWFSESQKQSTLISNFYDNFNKLKIKYNL